MDINQLLTTVKAVPMPRVLAGLGVLPASRAAVNAPALYHAPYRQDNSPSMSVYCNNYEWLYKDHSTKEHGTNIDILIRMGVCNTWRDAMNYISTRYLVDDGAEAMPSTSLPVSIANANNVANCVSKGTVVGVYPLKGSSAEAYVSIVRRIPIDVASCYLSFVRYTFGVKVLFGIGWPNINGGWSVRWPVDLGPGKGKTFIGRGGPSYFPLNCGARTETIDVFEGIFDFLSIVVLSSNMQPNDAIVLNSVDNLNAAMPIIHGYASVNAFLDTDVAGIGAFDTLMSSGINVTDRSSVYAGYKDVNEYVISIKM